MNKEKLMAKKKNKKKISLVFLLSLIFHLLLIFFIFIFGFKKYSNSEKKMLTFDKKGKNELPASLKPKKSNFGTTVLFDDIPQFTPSKTKHMAKNQQIKHKEEKITQKKREQNIKKDNITIPIEKKIVLAQKKLNSKIHKSKEKIKKQNESSKQIQETLQAEKIRNVGLSKKDKTPRIKRKSILSMTKGFLQHLKDEGNDLIKREGDDNKIPTLQDLKEASYIQKVLAQFQQEIFILQNQMSSAQKENLLTNFKSNPVILLIIGLKGNLYKLNLLNSSGASNYDKHIITAFKQAAPYPPIPKHLNKKLFKLPVKVIINSRQLLLYK